MTVNLLSGKELVVSFTLQPSAFEALSDSMEPNLKNIRFRAIHQNAMF